MNQWYALQCRFQQERKTKEALIARHYEVYLPLALIDKRKNRRITTYATLEPITEVLFPMYLFFQMDEGEDDFYRVSNCPGVTNIVRMTVREDGHKYPTVIHNSIIELLKSHEDAQGIHSCHKADYEKGDQIRVVNGAFKDFPGEIYSNDKDRRVFILVELFNAIKQIEVDYRDIEPA